ncbi:MAG: hypothetical protein NE330_22795 [Lentisphaeraceae bacterium]|nr:hypothetical protein [Lentisphaeraceae bacterium]
MLKHKKTIIIASGIITLFGLLTWFYYANTVEVEKTIDVGYSGKARQNSFLAVQRYAEYLNYYVQSRAVFPLEDLYSYDTILVSVGSLPTDKKKLSYIKDWVSNGGVLITGFTDVHSATGIAYVSEEIKDFLGISSMSYVEEMAERVQNDEIELNSKKYTISSFASVTVKGRSFRHEFLDENNNLLFGIRDYRQGEIWFISGLNLFANYQIDSEDNADFLDAIFTEVSSSILIVYRAYSPSIWSWLWENAQITIFLSFLFLSFWLMTMSKRFGPILPTQYLGSRKIMEHVDVMGQYLWAGGHTEELLSSLRKRVNDRIKKTNPSWLLNSKEKFYFELSEQCGVTTEEIIFALDTAKDVSEPELFYKAIKTLKRIKDSL